MNNITNDHRFTLKEFGARLKSARTKSGILQEDLANRLDISKRTLLEIEAGRSEMGVALVFLAAKELDVTVNSLLGIPDNSIVNSFNPTVQQDATVQQGINPTFITIDKEWLAEVNKRFQFYEEQIRKKDEFIESLKMQNNLQVPK